MSAGCRGSTARAWQRAAFPVHALAARKEPGGVPELLPGCRGAEVPGCGAGCPRLGDREVPEQGPDPHPGPPRRGAASPNEHASSFRFMKE